jgi:hypothetical protein
MLLPMSRGHWIVPRRLFASPGEFAAFAETARLRIQGAAERRAAARKAAPPARVNETAAVEAAEQSAAEYDVSFTPERREQRNADALVGVAPHPDNALILAAILGFVGAWCQLAFKPWGFVVLGQVVSMLGFLALATMLVDAIALPKDALAELPCRIRATREGLTFETALFEQHLTWDRLAFVDFGVRSVYLYFVLPIYAAWAIPRSAFEDYDRARAFLAFAVERAADAQKPKVDLPPPPGPRLLIETGNPYQPPRARLQDELRP